MNLDELIEVLNHCGKPGSDCHNCKMYLYSASCLKKLCCEAAATIESQQKHIADLEAELKEERYRHDRYVDFELAEAEELRKLKEQNRWISVTERQPEDDLPKDSKVKQIKVLVAYKTNGRWVTRTQTRVKGYWYDAPDKWDWFKISDPITHWMPLPEPPKEGA